MTPIYSRGFVPDRQSIVRLFSLAVSSHGSSENYMEFRDY